MSLWDEVKGNLAEWYNVTTDKTSELGRITTRRFDKFGISREIERQFGELGNFVYTGLKDGKSGILDDPAVSTLVERIRTLETELRGKDEEIAAIRREHAERRTASGAGADPAEADHPADSSPGAESEATLITDPILDKGKEESAILVEPGDDTGDSPPQPGD